MGKGGECFRRNELHSQAQGLRACALVRTVLEPCGVQSARHALGAPGRGGRGGRGRWGMLVNSAGSGPASRPADSGPLPAGAWLSSSSILMSSKSRLGEKAKRKVGFENRVRSVSLSTISATRAG